MEQAYRRPLRGHGRPTLAQLGAELPSPASATARQNEAHLEEGVWLVGGLLDGLEQRVVQALVVLDVVADVGQQDERQEALGHAGIQVGDEKSGCLVHCVGGPVGWVCEVQHLQVQIWYQENGLGCLRAWEEGF